MQYQIIGNDPYDPTGPDGQGHNRLMLYPRTPVLRCLLRPTSWQAAWEAHNRPLQATPTNFDPCQHWGGDCTTCPIANRDRFAYKSGCNLAVVRECDDGSVWILNRRDRGFGEFGYRYSNWAAFVQHENVALGSRKVDEHGAYFEVVPVYIILS